MAVAAQAEAARQQIAAAEQRLAAIRESIKSSAAEVRRLGGFRWIHACCEARLAVNRVQRQACND